ncbi:MAG: Porin [Ramlibacter sp.]|nr:Porin [Ramlibacter sp.]
MKKTLIAVAALAATGLASAQSSVTLFGVIDANLQHVSNSGAASSTRLANSGSSASRLGFRGTEDLGGGMSASFWLETGFNNDDGSGQTSNSNNQVSGQPAPPGLLGGQGLTFNRRSTVSLAGGWGELRLGRDYTPQFWSLLLFQPFGVVGVGNNQVLNSIITGVTAVRASNTIGYLLPENLGGFYGQAQYWLGENASNVANSKDGTGAGVRLGYAAGPVDVAFAYGRTKYATTATAGDTTQSNLAGSYNFGVAKLMALYERDKRNQTVALTGTGWSLGVLVPVGAGEVRVSYDRYKTNAAGEPTAGKLAVGYRHNLSKRTALYVTVARVRNSGGSAAAVANGYGSPAINASSSGYDLGLRHSF